MIDEFRLDLLRYLEANRAELEDAGEGIYAVVPPKSDLFLMFSGKNSRSLRPVIKRAAIFARGTPVALETYGTVRDARGFTSITYT